MTLYQRLCEAGLEDQIDHHCSDLYVFVTPQTTEIIEQWILDTGYHKTFYDKFVDQVTGKLMYDIPFQYDPWVY